MARSIARLPRHYPHPAEPNSPDWRRGALRGAPRHPQPCTVRALGQGAVDEDRGPRRNGTPAAASDHSAWLIGDWSPAPVAAVRRADWRLTVRSMVTTERSDLLA